jgi:hypothetical protein
MTRTARAASFGIAATVATLSFTIATPRFARAQTPTCAPTPVVGCRAPATAQKALLAIKKYSENDKDKLVWKWLKGSATSKADFGNPLSDTSYAFCVYDGAANLVMTSVAIGGDSCHHGVPCWQETATGFKYKDGDNSPSGPQKMLLKAGADGSAKIIWKGKGSDLDPPSPPLSQPVTVQLVNTVGVCWEAVYSAPALKNVGGSPAQFKDKAD